MATRTITLTGRPPVRIDRDHWPLIASASDKDFDGQASQKSAWFVGVRQHSDGRAIVYAAYRYSRNWQGARDLCAARGVLLTTDEASMDDICRAIEQVCGDIAAAEHDDDDAHRWPTLAAYCIADLPAEHLD